MAAEVAMPSIDDIFNAVPEDSRARQVQARTVRTPNSSDPGLEDRLKALEESNLQLRQDVDSALELARYTLRELSRRVTVLEEQGRPRKTKVNESHLDLLASELLKMREKGQLGVTYAQAARLLKLNKSSVCRLRDLIASDPRFNIGWHPGRKNTKIIKLKKYSTR